MTPRYRIYNADGIVVSDSATNADDCIAWAKDAARCGDAEQHDVYEAYDEAEGRTLAIFRSTESETDDDDD